MQQAVIGQDTEAELPVAVGGQRAAVAEIVRGEVQVTPGNQAAGPLSAAGNRGLHVILRRGFTTLCGIQPVSGDRKSIARAGGAVELLLGGG